MLDSGKERPTSRGPVSCTEYSTHIVPEAPTGARSSAHAVLCENAELKIRIRMDTFEDMAHV
jgi:hypothetical protein